MHDITIADATGATTEANTVDLTALLLCPRTVRVDGAYDNEGACYGCGACLIPVLGPWS
jgi:hypothetical protein